MYLGRQPGEDIQKNLGENIVHQLCSGFRHTGRNINTDNVFTSVPLAEHLLEKGLTIVGTLRQNKPDTPPVMKASRSREVHWIWVQWQCDHDQLWEKKGNGCSAAQHNAPQRDGGWKQPEAKTRSSSLLQPDQRRSRYYGPDGWQLHLQMPDAKVAHGALVQHDWCRLWHLTWTVDWKVPRPYQPTSLKQWEGVEGQKVLRSGNRKEAHSRRERGASWVQEKKIAKPLIAALWQLHTVKGDKMFVCVYIRGQGYGLWTCWMFSVRPPYRDTQTCFDT